MLETLIIRIGFPLEIYNYSQANLHIHEIRWELVSTIRYYRIAALQHKKKSLQNVTI